jgi:dipeptidyl aminopeptidase/acylaminoacyl peptidase
MKPEAFAPGKVSAEDVAEHSPAAFSPDGKELFWSGSKQGFSIYHMKIENGFWTKPEIAPFTKGLDATNPVFSLDGKRLFFTSQIIENGEWHITLWHVDKVGNDWSDPIKVESITRFGDIYYQVSFTKDGTIYSKLSKQSVYIASDESYIIFRRHVIGENDVLMDFYISFNHGGKWTEPVLFTAKLEAKGNGFWIGLSPDQKYIFFAKKGIPCRQYALGTSDIFWVSAKIIEGLRPKE